MIPENERPPECRGSFRIPTLLPEQPEMLYWRWVLLKCLTAGMVNVYETQ